MGLFVVSFWNCPIEMPTECVSQFRTHENVNSSVNFGHTVKFKLLAESSGPEDFKTLKTCSVGWKLRPRQPPKVIRLEHNLHTPSWLLHEMKCNLNFGAKNDKLLRCNYLDHWYIKEYDPILAWKFKYLEQAYWKLKSFDFWLLFLCTCPSSLNSAWNNWKVRDM